jgi:parallel beta-helix repeat protein
VIAAKLKRNRQASLARGLPRLSKHGKAGGVLVHDNGRGTLEDNDISGNAAGVGIKTGGEPTPRGNKINRNKKNAGVSVFAGGGGVHVPVKTPAGGGELDIGTRTTNALLCSLRCLGERGFALMSQRWRTLQRVMRSPGKIGDVARAALVLVQFEHKMIT